ncbi:MAG: DUF2914 domain-containing protein [Candidatus Taylorbacteria bacterium]|nr:DUF2914 domain-containing protein [Candidatus Taylorbacteria bacterium]
MNKFLQKIKRHGSSLSFIAGFAWDNIMLSRIDHLLANVLLGLYLLLSAMSIIGLNAPVGENFRGRITERYSKWLPFILQFCFGSLFSAYLVLYTRSASLSSDWPFLLFLGFLVISNELFRKRYFSITLPSSIFFVVLFSYSIFSMPILFGNISDKIFVFSGLLSFGVFVLFSFVLFKVAPEKFKTSGLRLYATVTGLFILFNLAYFSGFIPPIPISIKEIGVFHLVERNTDGNYTLSFEPSKWHYIFSGTSKIYNRLPDEPVYLWSSIFAPTKFNLPIFHRWQHFDESSLSWKTTDLLQFTVVGGRDEGFRGYTVKAKVYPAKWRVDVETLRGDLVGRFDFEIIDNPLRNHLLVERR